MHMRLHIKSKFGIGPCYTYTVHSSTLTFMYLNDIYQAQLPHGTVGHFKIMKHEFPVME
jgi:hypothetical protein